MRTASHVVLCVSALLWGWLFVGLGLALWAARSPALDAGCPYVLTARWRPWVTARWRYSTTIGFGVILQPGASELVARHERVHVRQFRDAALLALVAAAVAWAGGAGAPTVIALALCSPLYLLPHYLGAVLGGSPIYRGSEHERSAYAQTQELDGPSWQERTGIDG
jgi:hypothetical protein